MAEPQRFESYVSLLARGGFTRLTVEANAAPPLEFMHWSIHLFGAIFCEAHLPLITGELRISRLLGEFDSGRILNPKTAARQYRDGMMMGRDMALMEETQFGELNSPTMYSSPMEYHVQETEAPWTDIPNTYALMGAGNRRDRDYGDGGGCGVYP